MMYRQRIPALLVLLTCIAVAACNRTLKPPATKPVQGTVLVKGQPLSGVRVVFHPQFDLKFYRPSGITNAEGKFVIETAKTGDGAPRGEYIVTFELPFASSDDHGRDIEADAWKGKYANPDTSTFRVNINDAVELEPFRLE